MTVKPYKQQEEETHHVNESAVAYSANSSISNPYVIPECELRSVMRAKNQLVQGEYFTEEEMEKRISEWLN